MKTLSYKGYQASVEFEDNVLFVKVLHIDDLLIAQCDSASEAQQEMEALVDEYLADCVQSGRDRLAGRSEDEAGKTRGRPLPLIASTAR